MRIRKEIEEVILGCGAVGASVVEAKPVEEKAAGAFDRWIAGGNAAGMAYLSNYSEIRRDPRRLLEGARSIICCAFSFAPAKRRNPKLPEIAVYAYGDDYHDAIRRRLSAAAETIDRLLGYEASTRERQSWRVCVDTAPIMERYWAVKSGLGRLCRNGMVSVGEAGQMAFLAEIVAIWDVDEISAGERAIDAEADACLKCGECLRECPGGALRHDDTFDARRCISYLTIEHRGEWDERGRQIMHTPAGRHTLYGCDRCLSACPINSGVAPSSISEFHLRKELYGLDASEASEMTQEEFSRLFKGSAIKRVKHAGLTRNARNICEQKI